MFHSHRFKVERSADLLGSQKLDLEEVDIGSREDGSEVLENTIRDIMIIQSPKMKITILILEDVSLNGC